MWRLRSEYDEQVLRRTQDPMEEDALAPFADLSLDDTGAVQGPDRLQEFNDYGQLYEYTNGLFADFSIWDGGFESKHKIPIVQSPQPPVKDRSGIASESPELLADVSADVSAPFVGEICAFCLGFRALTRCPNCNSAYYCSTEHQAAHSLIHESSCGSDTGPSNGFQFSEGLAKLKVGEDLAPADSELRSEMLELLSMFQAVYEKKSAPGRTCSVLQKCISMCKRIMDRYYRIPQVVAMHEQATSLLQMFQNDEKNDCPFTVSPDDNRASSSGMTVRDRLRADVKEALDRVDAEESDVVKDSDGSEEVNGVYRRKGIWYCKAHTNREQCEQCGVDYRLLNELHRENVGEEVDATIRKEQDRLENLELQRNLFPPDPEPVIDEASHPTTHVHHDSADTEDFQSIAKDLKEELDRARKKEEADFLNYFTSFEIS